MCCSMTSRTSYSKFKVSDASLIIMIENGLEELKFNMCRLQLNFFSGLISNEIYSSPVDPPVEKNDQKPTTQHVLLILFP